MAILDFSFGPVEPIPQHGYTTIGNAGMFRAMIERFRICFGGGNVEDRALCAMQLLDMALHLSHVPEAGYRPSVAVPGVCAVIRGFIIFVNDQGSEHWDSTVRERTLKHVLPYLLESETANAAEKGRRLTLCHRYKMGDYSPVSMSMLERSPEGFLQVLRVALQRDIPALPDAVEPVTDEQIARLLGHDAGPAADLEVGTIDGTGPVAAPGEAVPLAGEAEPLPELVSVWRPDTGLLDEVDSEAVPVGAPEHVALLTGAGQEVMRLERWQP